MKKYDKSVLITLVLCSLAATLRLWGISNGLPDVLHPDENMLIRRAVRFGSGDLNPHFFIYPSLSIYLYFILHGFYFLFGLLTGVFHSTADLAKMFFTDPTWFYLLPRLLICSSDILSLLLITRIGGRLFDQNIGFVAGLMWALFPLGIAQSQIAKPDPMMVALALLSLWLLLREESRQSILLSGLTLGLSISAKYQSVIVFPIFLAWIFLNTAPWKKQLVRGVLFGVMILVGFIAGTPFSILSPSEFLRDFHAQSEVMRIGMFGAEGGTQGWSIYLKSLFWPGGSLPVGLAFFLGIALCLQKKRKANLIVVGIPAILFFGLGLHRIASDHYFYLGYPFVFLLSAYGFLELKNQIEKNFRFKAAISVVLIGLSLIPFYAKAWAHVRQFSEPDTRVSSRQWIEENIPPGSRILTDASAPNLKMTPAQLEDLYQRAKTVGHVKADYFSLMKKHSTEPTYYVFLTKQSVMLNPKNLVEYSRLVQDLIPVENGLDWIKTQDIPYVVVSSIESGQYQNEKIKNRHPAMAKYYEDIEEKGLLLAEFRQGHLRTGPTIKIYKL